MSNTSLEKFGDELGKLAKMLQADDLENGTLNAQLFREIVRQLAVTNAAAVVAMCDLVNFRDE